MRPEYGTAWRRKTSVSIGRFRFEKCKVVEPTDELIAEDDVLIVAIGDPRFDDEFSMAMNVNKFLNEYEPLQMSLFGEE